MSQPRKSRRPTPVVHQAPLVPPLAPVKTRLVIEVEHGCVDAVYASEPMSVEILDRDAIAVGNVKESEANRLAALIKGLHQVY